MSDPEFGAARQRKIAEIQRTGKTWQWPDPIEHPKRVRRRTWRPLIRQRLWFPRRRPRLSLPGKWARSERPETKEKS